MNPLLDIPIRRAKDITKDQYFYYHGGFILSEEAGFTAMTQKARGVFFLSGKRSILKIALNWAVPKHLLFNAGQEFTDLSFNYPVFARPCPTVPRHGFVDSIVCHSSKDLNHLSLGTAEVEKGAELLVTKPIDAQYNAIITDGVISFSSGNDGATAGKNVRYFYISDDILSKSIELKQDLLLPGEVPFYEIVFGKDQSVNLVQVRSAPGVPRCKDYIATEVTVKEIIKAEGDLLDWEHRLKTVDPKTTIIDHTNGSLSSHYAIHAIVNNVAIFTTYLPNIGDVIQPTVLNSEITPEDQEAFYRSFCYGFTSTENLLKELNYKKGNVSQVMGEIVQLALATLHNFSMISLSKDYELLGQVLGLFVRTTLTVSSGEARYAPNKVSSDVELTQFFKDNYGSNSSRENVYKSFFTRDTAEFLKVVPQIYGAFTKIAWGGGYGGKKWANCTGSSIDLFNACVNKEIPKMVELFNKVINSEHNGGKYLNKIIGVDQFDSAANDASTYSLVRLGMIVDTLYSGFKTFKTLKSVPFDLFKEITVQGKSANKRLSGEYGISEVIAKANDKREITHLEVKANNVPGKQITIEIPPTKIPNGCNCGEENCGFPKDVTLKSIPYYWATEEQSGQQQKIISKAMLNSLIAYKLTGKLEPADTKVTGGSKKKLDTNTVTTTSGFSNLSEITITTSLDGASSNSVTNITTSDIEKTKKEILEALMKFQKELDTKNDMSGGYISSPFIIPMKK